jgi:hypothetical protein
VVAAYVYQAKQGHQPTRIDAKITAKEFEREIQNALEANAAYAGVPAISNNTIIRFRQAWQLAAKDEIVADANTIDCGQVPNTTGVAADFDAYLARARGKQEPVTGTGVFDDPLILFKKRMARLAGDMAVMSEEGLADTIRSFSREGQAEIADSLLRDLKDVKEFIDDFARSTGSFIPEEAGEVPLGPKVTWATIMLDAVPERLHEKLYRAMIKVLHPDQQGDERAAQTLTQAYALRNRP